MEQQAIWVKWVDSVGQDGWTGRADALGLHVMEFLHIGFLIFEDEKQITLSPTIFTDGKDASCPYHSPIAIPKVAILERGSVNIIPNEANPPHDSR